MYDIISALYKIPAAREEFRLGDDVWFDNHINSLEIKWSESDILLFKPNQFCIYRVNS